MIVFKKFLICIGLILLTLAAEATPLLAQDCAGHGPVISGVRQRIIYAYLHPNERETQYADAMNLLNNCNLKNDSKDKHKEETHYYIGVVHYFERDYVKAYQFFKKASGFGTQYSKKGTKLVTGSDPIELYNVPTYLNDIKLKLYNQGTRAMKDAVENPNDPEKAKNLLLEAIDRFGSVLDLDPNAEINKANSKALLLSNISNSYLQLLNLETDPESKKEITVKVIVALENLAEAVPDNITVAANLIQLYDADKNNDKVLEWIKKALAIKTEDPQLQKLQTQLVAHKANLLYTLGKKEEALATYQEAIKINPNSPDLHFNLASLYLQRGEQEKALREFEAVKKLNPEDLESNYQVADESYRIYMKKRRSLIEEAGGVEKADMTKITESLQPLSDNATKNLDDAMKMLESKIPSLQDKMDAYFRLGVLCNYSAQVVANLNWDLPTKERVEKQKPYFEKAVPNFQKVVEAKPDNKDAWRQLATAYLNLQMSKEAEEAFKKANE